MNNRLFALSLCLAGAVFGILPGLTRAQAADPAAGYPSQPVRLVIGFAAGGPTDVIGRLLAQHMSNSMGQTVVVENRPAAAACTPHPSASQRLWGTAATRGGGAMRQRALAVVYL